ncbi:MAG: hypothetical protein JF616_01090 [Fibrobacteres bacterium]|nr:hypothetical protein [Fibrobacterota bacterium]
MRKRVLAAALLVLGGCIENPGVDKDLADRHNRLSADFTVSEAADRVRLRLQRTAAGTELYLANLTDQPIDSLDFFAQASDEGPLLYSGGIGAGNPVFDDSPVAEFNGRVVGLQSGMEADLGPLTGAFPRNLDEADLIFVTLAVDSISNPVVNRHVGYYSGVFTARDSTGSAIEGTLRGLVSDHGFHFWLRTGSHVWGALNGDIRGDSVYGIKYGDAVDYARRYAATTLAVALDARTDDSIGFAAVLSGLWGPGNFLDLRVTLSRSDPQRWPHITLKANRATLPNPPAVGP